MLNFFITNVVLGVALGFSILRHVPNTFRGVQLPSLAAKIKVSRIVKIHYLNHFNMQCLPFIKHFHLHKSISDTK